MSERCGEMEFSLKGGRGRGESGECDDVLVFGKASKPKIR